MVMVSGTSPALSPPLSCRDGAQAVAASDTTAASATTSPARRRILELIAVPLPDTLPVHGSGEFEVVGS
jgi:hypothetical protein